MGRSASSSAASRRSRRPRRSRVPWSSSRRSRIAKAQERVAAARAYSEQITEVMKDLAAAAGAEVRSPLLEPRPRSGARPFLVLVADRGLCGGYNSSVLRAAEGEVEAHRARGQGVRPDLGRSQGRDLLPLPRLHRPMPRSPASPSGRPMPTRRRSPRASWGCTSGARSTASRSSTRGSSAPACKRCCSGRSSRSTVPWSRAATRCPRRPTATPGRRRRTSSSRPPTRSSTACCRATSRPASTPRCSTRRRPSKPRASGP